jgi:translation initiation factor IF-2
MEQRRLRLGDILDDYCPRERRLTNHAVVAMIEEDVKQTRCTTCDAEHPYKGGKVPRRRKKETTAALYKEVLAGHLAADGTTGPEADSADSESPITPAEVPVAVRAASAAPDAVSRAGDDEVESASPDLSEIDRPEAVLQASAEPAEASEAPAELEEGPVHRPLIRAQLPRIEGQKEERRLPEFTIRQRSGGGHFRGGDTRMKPHRPGGQGGNGHSGSGGNGNRAHGGARFAGPRPAGPGGRGAGGRGGPAAGFRSGRKRSR